MRCLETVGDNSCYFVKTGNLCTHFIQIQDTVLKTLKYLIIWFMYTIYNICIQTQCQVNHQTSLLSASEHIQRYWIISTKDQQKLIHTNGTSYQVNWGQKYEYLNYTLVWIEQIKNSLDESRGSNAFLHSFFIYTTTSWLVLSAPPTLRCLSLRCCRRGRWGQVLVPVKPTADGKVRRSRAPFDWSFRRPCQLLREL